MAWSPAKAVEDFDVRISDAKEVLDNYSYGQELLPEKLAGGYTDTYTAEFGRAIVRYKTAVNELVRLGRRPGPITDFDTEFDWATKVQMGLVPRSIIPAPAGVPTPNRRPLWISVEGHLSDMWIGPAVEVGHRLEAEHKVQLQPTWYDNARIPFNNASGVDMICSFFRDPNRMWVGRPWWLSGFSQGDIVVTLFLLRHVFPPGSEFHAHLPFWLGAVEYGAPCRPLDVVAPWVADPPRPGTRGIASERMPFEVPDGRGGLVPVQNKVAYVCRRRDMYTETPDDGAGAKQTAIYDVVQGSWGPLLMELLRFGIEPTDQVIETAIAISRGALFLVNMDKHGGYVLEPGQDWARARTDAWLAAA
ncbi:MAG: hypothetical protein CMH38_02920 [Microbacterium sp.]|uniref:hypothetical protein n=1 Tax=Microbacterium sp. TaxID=51671 RepID=UPI000C5C30A2|nr:hypothetical protein [Microbacterium sp.]MAY48874.1 hypothetical protein [Microbacterium sp.]|tara:strand:- start:3550 stop:4632 length:1083 start_codon:yes stop_codon:yes gene_type:complete